MSFKEINQLRKEGKLEEALTYAQEDYNKEPDNIWNKRSLSWVYYEFAKKAAAEGNINSFLENVQKRWFLIPSYGNTENCSRAPR